MLISQATAAMGLIMNGESGYDGDAMRHQAVAGRFSTQSRFWRAVSLSLTTGLAFAVGGDASRLIFGRPPLFLFMAPVWMAVGGVIGMGYLLRGFRCGWRGLSYIASLAFLTVSTLHFVRSAPKRFGFLGESPMAVAIDPTIGASTKAIYTFPADPARVFESAGKELTAAGYRIKLKDSSLFADRSYRIQYPDSSWPVEDSVTIRSGRAMGKRFDKDAEYPIVSHQLSWVTVEVAQPDLLPFWIRAFVP